MRYIDLSKTIGFTETLDLINYLAMKGNEVYLICVKSYNKNIQNTVLNKNTKILETPSVRSFLGRKRIWEAFDLILYYIFSFLFLLNLNRKKKLNVIHFYPETILPLKFFSKFIKKKSYILDVRKPTITQAIEMENNSKSLLFVKLFYNFIDKLSIKIADGVIVISKGVKNYVENRISILNLETKRIKIIPCTVNLDLFSQYVENNKNQKLMYLNYLSEIKKTNKIMIYLGSASKIRNFEFILKSFKELLDLGIKSKLLILGTIEDSLIKVINKLDLDTHILIDYVPHNLVPYYLEMADVCLSYIPDTPTFRYSCPLKVIEYMAMGKPVVANRFEAHNNLIKYRVTGILTDNNTEDYIQGIKFILLNPKIADNIGIRAKKYVKNKHSILKMGKKYEVFIKDIYFNKF